VRIAGIEIGDLHAEWRIAEPSIALELADLLAVEGDGDDRRAHGLVAILGLALGVGERRLERTFVDLLRRRRLGIFLSFDIVLW
jgi:hypothetical protein